MPASSRLVPATLCGEAGWCAPAWREPARSSCDTPTSASPMPIVTPRARRHSSRRAPKRSRSHSRCIGCKRPTGSSARCTASSPRCPRRPTTGSSTRRWTIASARGPSAQSGPSVAPAGAPQLMPAAGSRLPLIACLSLAIHTLHIQRVHSTCTLHPCCQARGGSGARPTARPRRCPGARGGADVRACRGARARAGAARRPGGAAPCQKQAGTGCGQLALRRLLSAPEHASGCPELRPASGQPAAWAALAPKPYRPCVSTHRWCGARSACSHGYRCCWRGSTAAWARCTCTRCAVRRGGRGSPNIYIYVYTYIET